VVDGPRHVSVHREDGEEQASLRASHDGYAGEFGIVHQRSLTLSGGGLRLEGEDVFLPAHGESIKPGTPDEFAIRFHLHPSVKANRLTDRHGVMLVLPNREVWTFDAHADQVELEESVFLAGLDGPRRTVQIVIYGQARSVSRVQWTFAHTSTGQQSQRRAEPTRRMPRDEPELPL
jgi:uncharacterized heparinase superfamily protein